MSQANRQRGETTLVLGGVTYKLCLTLGAMSELEDSLGIESLTEIGEVMKKARTKDLVTLLTALLHGGGHKELTRENVEDLPLNLSSVMASIQNTFKAAGFDGSDDDDSKDETDQGK